MLVPIPARDQVRDYLLSFDLFERSGRVEEGIGYVEKHTDRILRTLEFMPDLPASARVLELGASPYFMTLLLKRHFGCDVTTANFFGDYRQENRGQGQQTIESAKYGEAHEFQYHTFNIELDPFPYEGESFDLVLCCEMLEHLAIAPSHVLREAHRVLRSGGGIVLTTPNSRRLENVYRLVRGHHNIYDPYSGYGVYGRHNREYMRWEVTELLRTHNFRNERVEERDAYQHGLPYRLLTALGPLRRRRDNLFASATREGASVERYPNWLYEHPNGALLIHHNHIQMGAGERLQLGEGWYDLELCPQGQRWTTRSSKAFLRPNGQEAVFRMRCRSGEHATHGVVRLQGEPMGEFRLDANEQGTVELPLPPEPMQAFRSGALPYFELEIRVDGALLPPAPYRGARETGERGIAVERLELA